jgi:hypothetical protein
VFRVKGLLPNMGICPNIPRKSQKIEKKKEMVHTVVDNAQVMFSGSRVDFQIRKLICFYSKNCQKITNNVQNVRYSF